MADASLIAQETIEIAVQVNGKVRDRVKVTATASKEETEQTARASEKIQKYLEGMDVKKVIIVPARIVNFIVAPKK